MVEAEHRVELAIELLASRPDATAPLVVHRVHVALDCRVDGEELV
jgi:hypothetical protein